MSVTLRKKKLDGGKTSLYLDIYHAGKRHYEFLNMYLTKETLTNKETLSLAQSIASKRQLEIQNTDHGFIPQFKRKANFVEYFEKLTGGRRADKQNWECVLKALKDFTGGSIQFSGITEQWLEEYKTFLLSRLKPNTASVYFVITKGALSAAVREKILMNNPGTLVKRPKGQEVEKSFLLSAELQMLAAKPCRNPEVKRAFLFSCYTGLRLSDVVGLTWGKIRGMQVDFRQQKTKGMEYMPLNQQARKLLDNGIGQKVIPMDSTSVFSLPSKHNIGAVIKDWCKVAGVTKRVSFHTSRHTFATLLLTNGADLYTVSKLLGHKSIQTTQVYAKVVDQKKRDAVALLPSLDVSVA